MKKLRGAVLAFALIAGVVAVSQTATQESSGADGVSIDRWAVPWSNRPVTVGTGFERIRDNPPDSRTEIGVVRTSNNGRWIAFTYESAFAGQEDAPGRALFLRDRWNDTTIKIADNVIHSVEISPNGRFVSFSYNHLGASEPNRVYDRESGEIAVVDFGQRIAVHVNNDGYFSVGHSFDGGPIECAASRVLDGQVADPVRCGNSSAGQIGTQSDSNRFSVNIVLVDDDAEGPFANATPAVRDASTGTLTKLSDQVVVGQPAGFVENLEGVHDTKISRNGRYVTFQGDVPVRPDLAYAVPTAFWWDTHTGEVYSWGLYLDAGPIDADSVFVGEVQDRPLNDGRVFIRQSTLDNPFQPSDPANYLAHPATPAERIDMRLDDYGEPLATGTDNSSEVYIEDFATDIGRVLMCTSGARNVFDYNTRRDCYLVQI